MDNGNMLTLAIGAAIAVERITEYLLSILFALLTDFEVAWREKISGGAKLLLTFVLNAGLYALLLRIDFVSPMIEASGVTISKAQGVTFSCLLVGGGSQLVHQFFGFFQKKDG